MKIEDLVLSVDQMNHLKELGLKVNDTALCWVEQIYDRRGHLLPKNTFKLEYDKFEISIMNRLSSVIPTLTLQEIFDILPKHIEVKGNVFILNVDLDVSDGCCLSYISHDSTSWVYSAIDENSLTIAYETLYWILENGYLKK